MLARRSFVIVATILVACQSGSATPNPAPAHAPSPAPHPVAAPPIVRDAGAIAVANDEPAATTYKRLCAPCHGAEGKGYVADHAPSLVTKTFLESADDEYLRRSIVFGRPGTSMAGYGHDVGGPLDAAAADRLVAYIRAWGPASTPLPDVAVGDAKRGVAIYKRNCQKCHGDRAVRGEAVHLANVKFQEIASDAFMRHAIVNGRPGTEMVAWRGQLTDAQIDDVIATIRVLGKDPSAPPPIVLLPAPTGKEPLVINPHGKAPDFTLKDGEYVPAEQVKDALAQHRKMIILDARAPSDWMRVHITGAISSPHYETAKLDAIPKDGTWVIAYCACPHHLSGIVIDELRKRGYTNTAVLDEGILDWHRRGFPVVAAQGVLPPPAEPKPSAP